MSGGGQGSKVLYDAGRWWRVQSGAQKTIKSKTLI